MQTLLKTKIGPFLVISSVLALWTLLVAQHVQAHTDKESLSTPSCSSLPNDDFFDDDGDGNPSNDEDVAPLTSANPER